MTFCKNDGHTEEKNWLSISEKESVVQNSGGIRKDSDFRLNQGWVLKFLMILKS